MPLPDDAPALQGRVVEIDEQRCAAIDADLRLAAVGSARADPGLARAGEAEAGRGTSQAGRLKSAVQREGGAPGRPPARRIRDRRVVLLAGIEQKRRSLGHQTGIAGQSWNLVVAAALGLMRPRGLPVALPAAEALIH